MQVMVEVNSYDTIVEQARRDTRARLDMAISSVHKHLPDVEDLAGGILTRRDIAGLVNNLVNAETAEYAAGVEAVKGQQLSDGLNAIAEALSIGLADIASALREGK